MQHMQPLFGFRGFVVVLWVGCVVVGENFCEVSKKSNLLSQSQITGCCEWGWGFWSFEDDFLKISIAFLIKVSPVLFKFFYRRGTFQG